MNTRKILVRSVASVAMAVMASGCLMSNSAYYLEEAGHETYRSLRTECGHQYPVAACTIDS